MLNNTLTTAAVTDIRHQRRPRFDWPAIPSKAHENRHTIE
jgi:hypothetical protein